MATNESLLSGGQLVVAALRAHGVDMAFSVAGESYLEVLDALFDASDIRLVTCRQEGGAAFMAEAYGKLTGKPGVLLVTRGPGACNASIGIHTAFQDSTPMVALVGQVARHQLDREAFQEVDFRRMFAPLAKWAAQIDMSERVPELINQGFHIAASGRPGPVVLALPEDMLRDRCVAAVAGPYRAVRAHPGAADVRELRRLLAIAERPMVLVGGSGWSDEACRDIAGFALANDLPVCCAFRRQDIVDNRLSCFVGDLGTGASPSLVARVRQADLLLAVGARIGEITSQSYSLLGIPEPGKVLIHVHASAEELGRVFRPSLAIQSGMREFAAAVAMLAPLAAPRWSSWREAARAEYEAGLIPSPSGGSLDLGEIMRWLRDRLPDDAIVTSDAGNFSGWPNRFLQYRRPGRQLGPTSGAMGYGVPAAVAAKLVHPDRLVVGFCGDGGFMMTGQELATSILEGTGPIILVFNNAMYGTIRMHQEHRFPGRVVGTALKNPDFLALARAYGVFGASITSTADFVPAFEEAASSSRAAVIELKMDPEIITTRTTLSEIRRQAEARQAEGAEA
ncbi:MAG: thiamine pyrophosphate-binding protein [Alphaproteobacteria bacterium]|nr:thiamine pyrophosphate-binding protein [Alphaproteobacteria bacterium]